MKTGVDPRPIHDIGLLSLVFGFIGAHLMHVLAYQPEIFFERPWEILAVWSGISSYGGFMGAGLAIWIYFRMKKLPFLLYAEVTLFGFLPGWVMGRLGCFTAHDHPGQLSNFFLAVKFPGGARHDLGFYEALLTAILSLLVFFWGRKELVRGTILFRSLLVYGLVRFGLDFLRATDLAAADARYGGLTPAQYCSLGFVALAIYRLWFHRGSLPSS